jgi:hypothetical protein
MTTFSPLSRGRYRCTHPGCRAVVKKAALDRHRGNHRKNPGTRSQAGVPVRLKLLADESGAVPSPAVDAAIARALGGPVMQERPASLMPSMAAKRRAVEAKKRGWWQRRPEYNDVT